MTAIVCSFAPPVASRRRPRLRVAAAAGSALVLFGAMTIAPGSPLSAGFASVAAPGRAHALPQLVTAAAAATPAIPLGPVDAELTEAEQLQASAQSTARYTLQQFMFTGVINWGGYKFTFYSQQVLPGSGLAIPGRHVNADGYVSDGDGYIVLAGSAPKGTVYDTPFGYQGKIYDRGTTGTHLDVYIR